MIIRYLRKHAGFTLVEMAVVLAIAGLLLGAFFVPLRIQLEQRDYNQALREIGEIKEALIGYAVVNNSLPCPDTDGDGISDTCLTTNSSTTQGNIPWVTLGIRNVDPWDQHYRYIVNNAFTTTFTLTTTPTGSGVIRVCEEASCANLLGNNLPAVVYSYGKNGTTQPPTSDDELENADSDTTFVSHTYSDVAGSEFDDLVYWVSSSVLMGRMVAAAKLP